MPFIPYKIYCEIATELTKYNLKSPTKDEIVFYLQCIDTGFVECGSMNQRGFSKLIYLDNDESGNGEREFLWLKVEKNCVSVDGGLKLTKEEKKKKWNFSDFSTAEELAEDIAEFTSKYVNSFELVRKL